MSFSFNFFQNPSHFPFISLKILCHFPFISLKDHAIKISLYLCSSEPSLLAGVINLVQKSSELAHLMSSNGVLFLNQLHQFDAVMLEIILNYLVPLIV